MDPVDVAFTGIVRQAELLRAGEISSRELVELYLNRIELIDPEINAFRVVLGDEALAAADAADKRRAGGQQAPLLGVPIAVKDNVDVAGQLTSFGTGVFDEPATDDSAIVRRLRDAGAVVLGKTNLPEFAICGFTESKTWGITRNPWHPGRTPGGSSGGSGAAVAAGLVGAAHASDGMGSIRFPAANCGLFWLKPQRDRVTLAPDAEHWYGLSVFGFITRTVLDTAMLLDIAISGEQMPTAPPAPERPFVSAAGSPPGTLRIAYSMKPPRLLVPVKVSEENRAATESMLDLLRSLGHQVEEVAPPYTAAIGSNTVARYLGGARADVLQAPDRRGLERRTRGFGQIGAVLGSSRAVRKATSDGLRRDIDRLEQRIFNDYDVFITPTTAQPPVEVGRWDGKGAIRTLIGMNRVYPFGGIWNHTGQPACSIPSGFDGEGLPLGTMMIARQNEEATLLALASQIESERPWANRRPALALGQGELSGREMLEAAPAASTPPSEPG